jgi:hypothetical protein
MPLKSRFPSFGSIRRGGSAGAWQCSNEKGTSAGFRTEIVSPSGFGEFQSKGDDVKMNLRVIIIERGNEAEKANRAANDQSFQLHRLSCSASAGSLCAEIPGRGYYLRRLRPSHPTGRRLAGHARNRLRRRGRGAKNSTAFLELAFATSHIGAVFLPINYRLSADEVGYIVSNSGARRRGAYRRMRSPGCRGCTRRALPIAPKG